MYMHTLWILKWGGNDSLGSKINRRAQLEAELGISMGGSRRGLGNDRNSKAAGGD